MDESNINQINKINFRPRRKFQKNWLIIGASFMVVVVLLGTSVWVFRSKLPFMPKNVLGVSLLTKDSQKDSLEEAKKLETELGKIMDLPTGEQPTVATVTDIVQLKDQPFFLKAKNGDKVLIYPKAKIAILYDPATHRIKNMGGLNAENPSPAQTQARIIIRNGTPSPGLAQKIETEIKKAFPDATITGKENAANDGYSKTIVVAAYDGAKNAAANLAKSLNVSVGDLPSNEKPPGSGADIIIIAGKDKI